MKNSFAAFLVIAALMPFAPAQNLPAPATASPASPPKSTKLEPVDERELDILLSDQIKLFAALEHNPEIKRLSQAEKERRVTEIMRRYERFIMRHPDSPEAAILYAKFLRLTDERAKADLFFQKAERLAPDLAVVQNQLGAYAAEEGNFARALPLLERATELEPETALYWYHLGEFLTTYKTHLAEKNLLSRPACEAKMQNAFKTAAELDSAEDGYKWRYAESFFDCDNKDWEAALRAWGKLSANAKTPIEHEIISLYRARVMIELGLGDQAREIIESSTSKQLEISRQKLRVMLAAHATPTVRKPATPAPVPTTPDKPCAPEPVVIAIKTPAAPIAPVTTTPAIAPSDEDPYSGDGWF